MLLTGTSACGLIQADENQTPSPAPPSPTSTSTKTKTAAQSPESSETPSLEPTPGANRAQVAFVKTTHRAEGIRRALALLGSDRQMGKA